MTFHSETEIKIRVKRMEVKRENHLSFPIDFKRNRRKSLFPLFIP